MRALFSLYSRPKDNVKFLSFAVCLLLFISFAHAQKAAPLGKLLGRAFVLLEESSEEVVIIYLTDKGSHGSPDHPLVSNRSLNRRRLVRNEADLVDAQDLPLNQAYVRSIEHRVVRLRHQLKWFNAVSAVATKRQIEQLRRLPFVREIDLVGRWKQNPFENLDQGVMKAPEERAPEGTTTLDYGTSFTQNNQIKVPILHNLGVYGQGVVVGVFDNGVRLQSHEAFASMNIIAQYDFVDHKPNVAPNNLSTGFGSHGVNTLSIIGGYKPGQLIGPTFKSDFILARTENDSSETPIEEDNWAAAIEWADSIGVDVTSTSLGYLTYSAPYTTWTWADLDGNTTLITRASDRAVSLGIVVVNSAGNAGGGDGIHNTLGAPADGDSVIAVGAVSSSGARTSFSSVGPTTDVPPRIKPDVMAMGTGVKYAVSNNTTLYSSAASGTSFSCPLVAGVAALLRCANPTLTPMQIRDALRLTASNAATPNNLVGWGVIDADSAMKMFGAIPMGHIRGTVFSDANGDGVQAGSDVGVAGRIIRLGGASSDSTITDGFGQYAFDNLAIGNYTVSTDLPAGWIQTSSPGMHSFTLLHAVDTAGIGFGTFQLGSIRGSIFNDINANGVMDGADSLLAGWTITLSGTSAASTISDSSGAYIFGGLSVGSYAVAESVQSGWAQTFPAANGYYQITMRSGLDTSGSDFGVYYAPNLTYAVVVGWNLLSLPVIVSDSSVGSVYPSATSSIYSYAGSYVPIDTIPRGVGYWAKFGFAQNIPITGLPRTVDSIDVSAGWNLIGALSTPIATASITSIPGGMITSNFFSYNGLYIVADSLMPSFGYWVKTSQSGKLILASMPAADPSSIIRRIPTSERPPAPPDMITEEGRENIPTDFALEQNFPNPFNPITIIRYAVPGESQLTLTVFDVLGRKVALLVDGVQSGGYKQVTWDASGVAGGIYYYRLDAVSIVDPGKIFSQVKKLSLIR